MRRGKVDDEMDTPPSDYPDVPRDSFVTRDGNDNDDYDDMEYYRQQPLNQPDPNFQNVGGEEYYDEGGYDEYPQQRVDVPPPPPSPLPSYQQPIGGSLPEQYSQTYARDQYDYQNPLAILDEIKKRPTPKGAKTIMIGGRPIDLHALEDYVVRVSPYHLRTILRYHNARTIEEIKNYSHRFGRTKMKGGMIILILLAVGMGVLGIIMMLYMPDILAMFGAGP